MYICEVAAFPLWESCHLGICYFGKCTFGKLPLGKIPLESCRLGKCLTSFLTWRLSCRMWGKCVNLQLSISIRIWLKIFISRTNVLVLTLAIFAKKIEESKDDFTTHKAYFIRNIRNKSVLFILKVVSSSSKNTNNPPPVYIRYNVNNKYVTFISFPFPFFGMGGGIIPTTSNFEGFKNIFFWNT